MKTSSDLLHEPNVAVRTYVVANRGEATGLNNEGLFNPVAGDQLYPEALLIVFRTTD